MDETEYVRNEILSQPVQLAVYLTLIHHFTIPFRLIDRNSTLALELSDLSAYPHALGQQLYQLTVYLVNLATQLTDSTIAPRLAPYCQL